MAAEGFAIDLIDRGYVRCGLSTYEHWRMIRDASAEGAERQPEEMFSLNVAQGPRLRQRSALASACAAPTPANLDHHCSGCRSLASQKVARVPLLA